LAAHPTYPNPTIIQVTCEIAFSTATSVKLSAGSMFPEFAGEFPEIHPIGSTALIVGQGQYVAQPDPAVSQSAQALRFATTDGRRFVQFSPSNFVYQSNDRYSGWKDFSQKLLELWVKGTKYIPAENILKIGLRYVNRIPKSGALHRAKDWFQPTADLPKNLLGSEDVFFARLEISPAKDNLRLITFAAETQNPNAPNGAIIFDIDRISTEQFPLSRDALSKKLDNLHEDIWVAFDSAGTDNLKKLLAGQS
jgi:uncharacterized protein (TIGR04255 family)